MVYRIPVTGRVAATGTTGFDEDGFVRAHACPRHDLAHAAGRPSRAPRRPTEAWYFLVTYPHILRLYDYAIMHCTYITYMQHKIQDMIYNMIQYMI